MDRVPKELAETRVADAGGVPHLLEEAWAQKPAVLVWVRHFGWASCREQVAELRPRISDIRAAGGEVVIVGSGAPHFVKAFREDLEIPDDVAIWCDEALATYKLAGFRRGVATLIKPRSALNYVRALRGGFRQKRTMGDATQQGGALVVKRDGAVAYHFVSNATGDHPPLDEVVAAVEAAA